MPGHAAEEFDCVETASNDSFPASDPPAWGSSRAAPSASTVALPNTAPHSRLKRLGWAILAIGAMLSFVEGMRRVRTR
jgi:hypothetical protein